MLVFRYARQEIINRQSEAAARVGGWYMNDFDPERRYIGARRNAIASAVARKGFSGPLSGSSLWLFPRRHPRRAPCTIGLIPGE